MTQIRVNGVSLRYEEHGSGEPILCLHGTGSSSALWADAATELARHGRTIVFDRRGFGGSERPDPFVTDVHQHADDAAALIDALDAGPAILIGRSQGGEIAVDLALRYPERVRALALLEGGGLSLSETTRRWVAELHARLFAAAEVDMGTVAETFLRDVLGDETWEGMPAAAKEVFIANGPAIVAEERGGLLDVSADELGTIDHPTLIVGGTGSPPPLRDATSRLAAAMPRAELAWVEGGHLIHPAHPAVLDFVDRVLAGRASRQAARVGQIVASHP